MKLIRIDELFAFEKGILQSSKCMAGKYNFITASAEWKTHNQYTHNCEALVFAAAASGSLGRTHYVLGKFIASDLCFILTPKDTQSLPIDLEFYHIIFNQLKEDIVKNTKAGTSKEAIGLSSFGRYMLPYFPVDKQTEVKSAYLRLKQLNNAVAEQLRFQENYLSELRQSFLKEAMQGKLVKQDKKGGDAKGLLQQIKGEKEKLIQQKRSKKEKPLPPITAEEIPFEIPENWVWCRLGELLDEIKYGTSKNCDYDSTKNSRVLRIPNVSSGIISAEDLKFTNLSEPEKKDLALVEHDLLIIRSNGSRDIVGKTSLVTSQFIGYAYAGYLVRLRFNHQLISSKFLWYATNSPYFRNFIEAPLRTTVGINNINTEEISSLIVPLPPLYEQQLIVQKLDQLMQYCDALQQSIEQSKQQNQQLLQVVLKEALQPKAKTYKLQEEKLSMVAEE